MSQVAETQQYSREFDTSDFIFNHKSHINPVIDKLCIMFDRHKVIHHG